MLRVAAAGLIVVLPLLLAACSSTPGPRGWAGARPVSLDEPDLVLAAYKKELFAIDPTQLTPTWQFPPENRDSYAVSERSQQTILELIDALSIPDDQKDSLSALVSEITISGDSIDTFKDAVDNSAASDDEKTEIKDIVDEVTDIEETAVGDVEAFYGDIGISDDGETAYAPGYGGWLYALNVETGEMRWMVNVDSPMVGGVAVDGDRLYLGAKSHRLYALSAADGARIDEFSGDGAFEVDDEVWATPAVTDDAIYVTTMNGSLYRVDKGGEQQWQFEADAAIAMRAVPDGDSVYVGAYDKRLYAIDAATGDPRWSFGADEWFWSAPVVDGDAIFAASLDGKMYALGIDDGSTRWERPYDAGAQVRAALAMGAQGVVVAGRDGLVHQVDKATGEAIGVTLQAGQNIEADLTSDTAGSVYAVPRDPALLYIIDTSSQLAAQFFELPQ